MSFEPPSGKLWDERLRSTLDASPDAIVAFDESGEIVDWNSQAVRTFHWPKELSRLRLSDLFKTKDLQEILESIRQLTDTAASGERIELVARRTDGNLIPVELSIGRVVFSGKNVLQCLRSRYYRVASGGRNPSQAVARSRTAESGHSTGCDGANIH